MKIAFISYEFPPDTAFGGIAAYVYQAARMLHDRGHYIEVFSGSCSRSCTENPDGFLVHRIKELNLKNFYKPAGQLFAKRHADIQFDVLEGPEYSADAREAVRLVPDIALVIKLHTPSILLFRLNFSSQLSSNFLTNIRYCIGSLLSGVKPRWGYNAAFLTALKLNEIERLHALEADEIASPSKELGQKLVVQWDLNPELIAHIPYPYKPDERLLNIPVDTDENTITFLGRLELRKGVVDLAKAIPIVLNEHPNITFRFVGPSDISPRSNVNMEQYLRFMLKENAEHVEFKGYVQNENIPDILSSTDICVFPSIWENFPFVCLESMAAGRGIVASNSGGMREMLDDGKAGILIPPGNPDIIAKGLSELIRNKEKRLEIAQAARSRLLKEYNTDRIGALQEAGYMRAVQRRRLRGTRQFN